MKNLHKSSIAAAFVCTFSFLNCFFFRIVCFDSYEVMKRALDKYDGEEINGKKIRLVEETKRSEFDLNEYF